MMWQPDPMVQIIKGFASLPDKGEPQGSQHNKAPRPRWLECSVPSFAVVHIFGHRGLQINYNVGLFFCFAFSVDKNTKGPFQNPLCYASASCSEIHSMVPNIYQKTALRGEKKKKMLTETKVVPPSTGRHIELNKRKNNPIILYYKVKQFVICTKRLSCILNYLHLIICF